MVKTAEERRQLYNMKQLNKVSSHDVAFIEAAMDQASDPWIVVRLSRLNGDIPSLIRTYEAKGFSTKLIHCDLFTGPHKLQISW